LSLFTDLIGARNVTKKVVDIILALLDALVLARVILFRKRLVANAVAIISIELEIATTVLRVLGALGLYVESQ